MKLKLQRSQKSGLTGNVTFKMLAIVDLDDEEAAAVKKYKLGKEVVYQSPKGQAAVQRLAAGPSFAGITATIAAKATNQILTIDNLVQGKEIACKDITEMLAAEEQIREACHGFARILTVARHFGGEEVIDIDPFDHAVP